MEFVIDSVEKNEDLYCIRGGCTQGIITVGSFFLKVYKYIREATSEGYFLVTTEREDIRDVKLQVKKIVAYRHTIDELYSGMSGELWLAGEGGTTLEERDFLGLT